jgi:hypothetical protein
VSASLALALALLSPPTDFDDAMKRGRDAMADGRFDEAAAEFVRAYGIDPQPAVLLLQAHAERSGGHCVAAVELYERFLESTPPPGEELEARAGIEACTPQAEEPGRSTPARDTGPQPQKRAPTDPFAHGVLWTGVGLGIIGGALLGDAQRRKSQGPHVATEQEYVDLVGPAVPMSRAGIAFASVGGTLAVLGIVRFIVVAVQDRKRKQKNRSR